jgi:hypothetical protein
MILEFALVTVIIVMLITWVAWEIFGNTLTRLNKLVKPRNACADDNAGVAGVDADDADVHIADDEYAGRVVCRVNTNTSEIDCVVRSGHVRVPRRLILTETDGRK